MNKIVDKKLTRTGAGRPAGSLNKRTLIRNALATAYSEGEQGFWLAVTQMAVEGDIQAMQMLADRLYPKLKSQAPEIELDEPLTGNLADMAKQIVQYAGSGKISTTQAVDLLNAIANAAKIIEQNELEIRMSKLEENYEPKKTLKTTRR